MRKSLVHITVAYSLLLVPFIASQASAETTIEEVQRTKDEMEDWLRSKGLLVGWRKFLKSDQLDEQLAKGNDASSKVVAEILDTYKDSGVEAVKKIEKFDEFKNVRQALERWVDELRQSDAETSPEPTVEGGAPPKPFAKTPPKIMWARAQKMGEHIVVTFWVPEITRTVEKDGKIILESKPYTEFKVDGKKLVAHSVDGKNINTKELFDQLATKKMVTVVPQREPRGDLNYLKSVLKVNVIVIQVPKDKFKLVQ